MSIKVKGILTFVVMTLGLILVSGCTTAQTIRPTAVWPDDRGQHIQAHGGGIIKLADTYYWFGEDRSRDNLRANRYVACYSSEDLAHWTFRNQVLKLVNPENLQRDWALERP